MMNIDAAFGTVENLKKHVIPQIKQKLQSRLDSFRSDTFLNMKWIDPANWDSESITEVEMLRKLAEIFTVPLSSSQNATGSFNVSKLVPEWKNFKHMVKHFYPGIKASVLWERVLQYRRKQFPNLCQLAEIVLAVGVSNSVVESGFSFLTCMLTDRRLSMCHETMENLLVIKLNNLVWKDADRDSIIQMALNNYCQTRRKSKIDKSEFNNMFQPKRSEGQELENPLNLEEVCEVDSDLESSGSSESETDSCDSEPERVFWEFEA